MDSMEATIRHIAEDGNEHLVGYHPFHIAQGPDCFPIEISEGFFFFFRKPFNPYFSEVPQRVRIQLLVIANNNTENH